VQTVFPRVSEAQCKDSRLIFSSQLVFDPLLSHLFLQKVGYREESSVWSEKAGFLSRLLFRCLAQWAGCSSARHEEARTLAVYCLWNRNSSWVDHKRNRTEIGDSRRL